VRELAGNGRDGAMVRRLVELCRDLKIRTVAEMVETAEVEDVVRKAGVDFAQGWLFGKPADQPQPALKIGSVTPAAAGRACRRAGGSPLPSPLREKVSAWTDEGSLKRQTPRPAFRLIAAFLFFNPSPDPTFAGPLSRTRGEGERSSYFPALVLAM
jgi:hypothetical protein